MTDKHDLDDDRKQIWKFPLNPFGTILNLPAHSTVIHVELQTEQPTLWVEVLTRWMGEDTEPLKNTEKRSFTIYGTGHDIPYDAKYIGTVHQFPFVWHVYEDPADDS